MPESLTRADKRAASVCQSKKYISDGAKKAEIRVTAARQF
jgi:hypothetical protein